MSYNWHRVMLSGRGHECRIIGIELCYLEGGA